MGSEGAVWPIARLGDLCDIFDGPHATPTKTENGPVFLSISSLVNGRLDLSQSARLSETDFERWTRRVTPTEGDVVFSYETRLGQAALIPSGLRCCLGRRMGLLRPKTTELLSPFLLYAYLAPEFQRVIAERQVSGSTVPRILLTEMGDFPLRVPPLGDQRRIVGLLGALDDKIESNRCLAALLEETAAALFRARFIDFVGVTDLVESEIGPIPRGWRAAPLAELADVTMGQSPPSATYGHDEASGLPLVQGAGDYGTLYVRPSRYCSAPTRTAAAGAVLMTVRAPVGRLNLAAAATCIGRGVAAFESRWPSVTWLVLGSLDWRADESGTIFPAVNKRQVMGKRTAVPAEPDLDAFERVVAPLLSSRSGLHRESETLAELRDTLLPNLVSGRIRVPEAEGLARSA